MTIELYMSYMYRHISLIKYGKVTHHFAPKKIITNTKKKKKMEYYQFGSIRVRLIFK